jgi:hypothetical protein
VFVAVVSLDSDVVDLLDDDRELFGHDVDLELGVLDELGADVSVLVDVVSLRLANVSLLVGDVSL